MLLYGDISLRAVQREEDMVQQHPVRVQYTYASTGGARNESYLMNAARSGSCSSPPYKTSVA